MLTHDEVKQSADFLRGKLPFIPEIGIVLGSGLGPLAEEIEQPVCIPYGDIPHFRVSTAPDHAGRLVCGTLSGRRVVCMQGRLHGYEGYAPDEIAYPVYVLRELGIQALVVTNASGGINTGFEVGDFMLIEDHINLTGKSPLTGANDASLGTRFPDMSHVYDPELCDIIRGVAKDAGIAMQEGVYCQLTGPCFETPAEVRMLGVLGADAVGMSTAVEAVAARHCGMRVCGISCVCNKGAGLSPTPLTHEEVQAAADAAAPLFKRLVKESIVKMCR